MGFNSGFKVLNNGKLKAVRSYSERNELTIEVFGDVPTCSLADIGSNMPMN